MTSVGSPFHCSCWAPALAQSADDEGAIGTDSFYGRGFVNARRAVTE